MKKYGMFNFKLFFLFLILTLGVFTGLAKASLKLGVQSTYLWRGIEMMDDDGEAFIAQWSYTPNLGIINLTTEAKAVFNNEYEGNEWKLIFGRFAISGNMKLCELFDLTPWIAAVHKNTETIDDDDIVFGLRLSYPIESYDWILMPFTSFFTDLKGGSNELDYTGTNLGLMAYKRTNIAIPFGMELTGFGLKALVENINPEIVGMTDYTYGVLGVEVKFALGESLEWTFFLEGQTTLGGNKNFVKAASVSGDDSNILVGIRFRF